MSNSSSAPTPTTSATTTGMTSVPDTHHCNICEGLHSGGGDGTSARITSGDSTSTPRVQFTGSHTQFDDHLDKLLECPVCYDVILPPIISCCSGHSCCETCRASVENCPVCRGELSNVRNLLVEQLLEKCQFKCKHGCNLCLPAKDLANHYLAECAYRPIHCRECDRMIPFDDFLRHVDLVDKLERQKASECSTGFEIDEEDLAAHPVSPTGRRITVWEPTWMNCYNQNFFCSLDYNGEHWWVWVASLNDIGCELKCQIILWSKLKESEHTYYGTIHSIRASPDSVLQTGECLILTKTALKNFMYQGGIDVLVRIEHKYVVPKTRRGVDVQSPLEIMTPPSPVAERFRRTRSAQNIPIANRDELETRTPTRAVRAVALRRETSRIPVFVLPPSPIVGTPGSIETSDVNTTHTVRRVLFDTLPPRGAGTSGTASDMRYRINRGYRHAHQLRSRTVEVELTNAEMIDISEE